MITILVFLAGVALGYYFHNKIDAVINRLTN